MRICVNALSVVTGGGLVNLTGLLRAIAGVDGRNEYIILVPENRVQSFITGAPNFRLRPMYVGVQGAAVRLGWEQTRLARLLEREQIDLLFSPANLAPIRLPKQYRSVVKVQNIAPFSSVALRLERGAKRRARLRALRLLTLASLRRADAAIFISRASAALLAGKTRRAEVIYDGLTEPAGERPEDARDMVARRFGITPPFVLCVADFYPHKNIQALVRGFGLIPSAERLGVRLVLVGHPLVESYAADVREEVRRNGLSASVTIIEGVPRAELDLLYAAASSYAFPSLVEAGGTTLVEAMAAGLPVVASNVEPMPEFCGDAALYCDPRRPGEWASAISRALTDEPAVRRLVSSGRARAAEFRWEDAARRTVQLFEAVGAR
jgi:glycosyltransferase involved in cell wall biosynthesis